MQIPFHSWVARLESSRTKALMHLVNECLLLYKVRHKFPLHYKLFRQVSSHLFHEVNTEQLFSHTGALSEDNGKTDPERLAVWIAIGMNMRTFKQKWDMVHKRYMDKYRSKEEQDPGFIGEPFD